MSTTIILPTLTAYNAVKFCRKLSEHSKITDYIFDYSLLTTCEPFGMLLTAARMRQFMASMPHVRFGHMHFEGKEYPDYMGFFDSIGVQFGQNTLRKKGSFTHLPITYYDVIQLKEEAREESVYVGETIEKRSASLANILSQQNPKLEEYLTYSLREIMRNVVEHSESDKIWFAAQYWPSRDWVELAILDEGIGIRKSLTNNPNINLKREEDAILLAIEPGVSGKVFTTSGKKKGGSFFDDQWQNSGYGLYMTSSICQNGGNFLILSDNLSLLIEGTEKKLVHTNFRGTAIRMRLRPSLVRNLSKHLEELREEGKKRAKENKESTILSASKVSRMLVVKK